MLSCAHKLRHGRPGQCTACLSARSVRVRPRLACANCKEAITIACSLFLCANARLTAKSVRELRMSGYSLIIAHSMQTSAVVKNQQTFCKRRECRATWLRTKAGNRFYDWNAMRFAQERLFSDARTTLQRQPRLLQFGKSSNFLLFSFDFAWVVYFCVCQILNI